MKVKRYTCASQSGVTQADENDDSYRLERENRRGQHLHLDVHVCLSVEERHGAIDEDVLQLRTDGDVDSRTRLVDAPHSQWTQNEIVHPAFDTDLVRCDSARDVCMLPEKSGGSLE